jgi:hypothetical protein
MSYADVLMYDMLTRLSDPDDFIYGEFDKALKFSRSDIMTKGDYPSLKAMNSAVNDNAGIQVRQIQT